MRHGAVSQRATSSAMTSTPSTLALPGPETVTTSAPVSSAPVNTATDAASAASKATAAPIAPRLPVRRTEVGAPPPSVTGGKLRASGARCGAVSGRGRIRGTGTLRGLVGSDAAAGSLVSEGNASGAAPRGSGNAGASGGRAGARGGAEAGMPTGRGGSDRCADGSGGRALRGRAGSGEGRRPAAGKGAVGFASAAMWLRRTKRVGSSVSSSSSSSGSTCVSWGVVFATFSNGDRKCVGVSSRSASRSAGLTTKWVGVFSSSASKSVSMVISRSFEGGGGGALLF